MKIEPLKEEDIPAIAALQPEGWGNILPQIIFYLRSDFCFTVKAVDEGAITGIGTKIIHGRTAWLAHIIVHPDHRNRGIGGLITRALVDSLRDTSCETILLIATKLGEPVYRKAGFEADTEYIFLKGGNVPSAVSSYIIPFDDRYRNDLLALDRKASGEERSHLLLPHLAAAHLFVKDQLLLGYYLPSLGDGLVIAVTPVRRDSYGEAGLALLTLRGQKENKFVLPATNTDGIDFLLQHHYQEFSRGTRMWLGKKLSWNPLMLYNRIGGNFG